MYLPKCQGIPYSKQGDIWSLNGGNGIQTYNHLVRKRTLNHEVELANLSIECSFTNYVVVGSNTIVILNLVFANRLIQTFP